VQTSNPPAPSSTTASSQATTPPASIPTQTPAVSRTTTSDHKANQAVPGASPVVTAPTQTVSLSLTSKIAHLDTLNWGQRVTIFLLFMLLLINLLKHTIVWRKQKRGWRHIWLRSHPAFQACMLLIALVAVLVSSFGVVA
jgi:hypothetical protein